LEQVELVHQLQEQALMVVHQFMEWLWLAVVAAPTFLYKVAVEQVLVQQPPMEALHQLFHTLGRQRRLQQQLVMQAALAQQAQQAAQEFLLAAVVVS
jgi:hypothetical protein